MKNNKMISVFIIVFFLLVSMTTVAFSKRTPQSEADVQMSDIEAQKAKDILFQQSLSEADRAAKLEDEKAKEEEKFKKEKQEAISRYKEVQKEIDKINTQSQSEALTEDKKIELINLQDELMDLDFRYELSHTVMPEEKLKTVIDTLKFEGDNVNLLYQLRRSQKSEDHEKSLEVQIFLGKAYGNLANDVQTKWDNGASIDSLFAYIDTEREKILSVADAMKYGDGD